MNLGIIMCHSAPYRTLQINEFAKIKGINITVYYTFAQNDNREWEDNKKIGYKVEYLKGYKFSEKYGYINYGLFNIVKNNDVLLIGGYSEVSYIILSLLSKIFNKKYGVIFDGISTNRINDKENKIKKFLKNIVVKNSNFIFANGKIGKEYFKNQFKYNEKYIYNQYLTVDSELINSMYNNRFQYRSNVRKKLNIKNEKKVVIFSGRLISIKNVEIIIEAISKIKEKDNIIFLVTGGGILKEKLEELASKKNVKIYITNFIKKQEELFKYYFAGDVLVLPSIDEPWGLVVNEAMNAGLPVIVSDKCGCSMDLVKDGYNGYIFNSSDVEELKEKLQKVLFVNSESMGKESRRIISNWTFKDSRKSLEDALDNLYIN
ncbi:glycosyltransferase [Clostridium perfringens]|uniref:Glycosyltransferase n=1 Tax=Clostridium perfringens TaxID=1502 RepID=A0AAW9I9E0_CLOPF|nr:glycosyltransferase family 4 protein [Clostridium perfringens]MDH5092760.1 D-inositol 3-phosphate glycosyltransferase [Clostridium perfringens]MDZ4998781.1 glycosyltransferase [Clostridium perfringens]